MRFTKKTAALALAIASLGAGAIGVASAQEAGSPAPESRQEMREKFREMRQQHHAEMLARFDANKDGKLDENERKVAHDTLTAERFKALDTNGDGVLSLAEFQAGAGKLGHHFGHRGGPGAPGAK